MQRIDREQHRRGDHRAGDHRPFAAVRGEHRQHHADRRRRDREGAEDGADHRRATGRARGPSTGTTKVCTSQHDDSNQFTSSRRRNIGSRSRSQAGPVRPACGRVHRRQLVRVAHPEPGDQGQQRTISRNASRNPPWSIGRPAANGPMKLENAGPIASQENTCLQLRRRSRAARPTWRCSAIDGGAGRAAGQQRGQAQHREHREGDRQRRAPSGGGDHGEPERALQAVPVGVAPGRQRQEHLRQREQRQQHADRRLAVALRAAPAAARPAACRPCWRAGRPAR